MRIVLHVGTNKAGSTAIQHTLSRSGDKLSAQGMLFPKLGVRNHHSYLLPAILDDDEYPRDLARQDPVKRQEGVTASEGLWDSLRRQARENSPHVLLLSSEYIFGLRSGSLKRFISRLAELSDDISAVAYLRDPCEHYLSSAQQILKYGASVKDPRVHQYYGRKLRKCEGIIPGAVRPRVFSRPSLHDGDVTLDFLSQIVPEDQVKKLKIRPLAPNVSLSAEAMAFLNRFNREIWGTRRFVGHKLNRTVLEAIENEEKRRRYTKAKLKDEIRSLVTSLHSEDAAQLRDTHGVRFPKFDYSLDSTIADRNQAEDDRFLNLKVSDIVTYDADLEEQLTMRVLAGLAKKKD